MVSQVNTSIQATWLYVLLVVSKESGSHFETVESLSPVDQAKHWSHATLAKTRVEDFQVHT